MTDAVSQHAALLAKVEVFHDSAWEYNYPVLDAIGALRAVLELHAPRSTYPGGTTSVGPRPLCFGDEFYGYDGEHPEWPCDTIRAVAEALGVDLNG